MGGRSGRRTRISVGRGFSLNDKQRDMQFSPEGEAIRVSPTKVIIRYKVIRARSVLDS